LVNRFSPQPEQFGKRFIEFPLLFSGGLRFRPLLGLVSGLSGSDEAGDTDEIIRLPDALAEIPQLPRQWPSSGRETLGQTRPPRVVVQIEKGLPVDVAIKALARLNQLSVPAALAYDPTVVEED
jgi:hypothetical protein